MLLLFVSTDVQLSGESDVDDADPEFKAAIADDNDDDDDVDDEHDGEHAAKLACEPGDLDQYSANQVRSRWG